MNKKVSIITVVYNDKKGMEKTIKSVISQICKNYEYIVIDGNSTDGTVDIIKKFSNHINYWISETDKGIYDAMNKGAKRATGEYLYFLNAGDYFCDSKVLEYLQEIIKNTKADLINGKVVKLYSNYKTFSKPVINKLKFGVMPPHQGAFVKKSVFKKLDGFNQKYKSSGDFDFFCRFYIKGFTYKMVNRNIADMIPNGMSSNKSISVNETYKVIKVHFGFFYGYIYYINKMIMEQGIKKILLILGMKRIYKKILKIKIKGEDYK